MRVSDPLNALAAALTGARLLDLPDVVHTRKGQVHRSRPPADQLDVKLFQQTWASTALGFDAGAALAGQAFTLAPTVIVMHAGAACVYFAEGLAYRVLKMNNAFMQDMMVMDMAPQSEAVARYGAEIPSFSTQG